MSLIDEALKRARLDAARQDAARQTLAEAPRGGGFASPWAHMPPAGEPRRRGGRGTGSGARQAAFAAVAVVSLAIGAAGITLYLRSPRGVTPPAPPSPARGNPLAALAGTTPDSAGAAPSRSPADSRPDVSADARPAGARGARARDETDRRRVANDGGAADRTPDEQAAARAAEDGRRAASDRRRGSVPEAAAGTGAGARIASGAAGAEPPAESRAPGSSRVGERSTPGGAGTTAPQGESPPPLSDPAAAQPGAPAAASLSQAVSSPRSSATGSAAQAAPGAPPAAGAAAAPSSQGAGAARIAADGGTYVGEVKLPDGSAVKLSGIAFSDLSPVAVINGKVLGPGQGTEQITVDKIEADRVTLRARSGILFYLRLN